MNLNKLSNKEKIGLGVGIFFVLAAFLDGLVFAPISQRLSKLDMDIRTAKKELSLSLRNIKLEEAVKERYQRFAGYVKMQGADEEEVAKILGVLENLGRKSEVSIVDIKPHAAIVDDFSREYRVEIEAEGGMERAVSFLYNLNSAPQLLRTQRLRLTRKDKDSNLIKISVLISRVLVP